MGSEQTGAESARLFAGREAGRQGDLEPGPELPIQPLTKTEGCLPSRSFLTDAGLDLYVSRDTTIGPREHVDVHHDIAIELPTGYWGFIIGRSSTLRRRHLQVIPAVIDNGFRGELFTYVWNTSEQAVTIAKGERLAQLILLPLCPCRPVWVSKLAESGRGHQGFGSSGT